MNRPSVLLAMIQADLRERTRRYSFLTALCLALYLGYAVNTGQILIKLQDYRGVYNSAWVGSLMALVITFFLGVFGFYLVKNSIERDERTGVGQIIATTPVSRPEYLLGKWLSNFAVLSLLVAILALSAVLMQLLQGETARMQIWALLAPFLFIALPVMALVAATAIFFESVSWLKGGFGNLVYFGVFIVVFSTGLFFPQFPILDVSGFAQVGASMKAAVLAADPTYNGNFVFSMADDPALKTFVWTGLAWTLPLILQRLVWVALSAGLVLAGAPFFNRFDPNRRSIAARGKATPDAFAPHEENETPIVPASVRKAGLTPLHPSTWRGNFPALVRSELRLMVKGLKWYWLAGMAALWLGCVAVPLPGLRDTIYMAAVLWPVLVWSQMGQREARCRTESLIFCTPHSLARLPLASWLAGVAVTVLISSGVLVGRAIAGEPLHLTAWALGVIFIPSLALALGTWSHTSKLFEVVYPILWYLGPFNRQSGLARIDYLGFHAGAPANVFPLLFAGFILALLVLAFAGRWAQMQASRRG
jgi:ABC-type transport system involved in multi-copper enzyme maturation permease subunit